jgi:hypothetical protein
MPGMMRRRAFALTLAVCTTALALGTGLTALADPAVYDKLFFIQRSKNANEVHYDARVNGDGTLDGKEPVVGYWWNKAEDGSRKSISLIQRIAYGYDVDPGPNGTWVMKLKALSDRPLTLLRVNGHWRAQVPIGGKPSYMNRIYVATDESGVFPKVLYVDVFGEEIGSGKPIQEHLVKN